jgi:hypothetical protein
MIPFVLSYVRQRPHDQYFWRDLKSFIAGPVTIPKFKLSSEVVLRRHGFSAVLAYILASYERSGGQARSLWGPPWREISQFVANPNNAARIRAAAHTPIGEIAKTLCRIYQGIDEAVRARLTPSALCADFFDRINRMEPLFRPKGDEGCIKLLGDYGILPTYSFPIYVDELRLYEVQPNDQPRRDLNLTRDRRISLTEYHPGRTITAGKTHIRSKGIWEGFERKPFRRCSNCEELSFAPNAPNNCDRCGGPSLPMTAIIPWGGYYGSVAGEGFAPEVEIDDVASSEVLFDPANDPRPTPRPEGKSIQVATIDANMMRAARMRQFSPRPGSRNPLRLEVRRETDAGAPRSPANCLGIPDAANIARAQTFCLLHEFTTDIARIRIGKGRLGQTVQSSLKLIEGLNSSKRLWYRDSFWKTLAEALLIASAKLLDIDEVSNAELGVTFRTEAVENCLDDRELILYDTAPGGAGYSTEVAANLRKVFERAAGILRDCSCGDSCYRCLRSYRNQWIHSRLDRLLVSQGLDRFMDLNWS